MTGARDGNVEQSQFFLQGFTHRPCPCIVVGGEIDDPARPVVVNQWDIVARLAVVAGKRHEHQRVLETLR